MRSLLSALLLARTSPSAIGQIQATAVTTGVGLRAMVGNTSQTLPTGTIVSAGASVQAIGVAVPPPFSPSEATSTFTMTTGLPALFATLTGSAHASVMEPAANLSTSGDGEVLVQLTPAIPIDVEIMLTINRISPPAIGCDAGNAFFTAGGVTRQSNLDCPPMPIVPKPCVFTIPATIDAAGMAISLGIDTFAVRNLLGGCFSGSASATSTLGVRPLPRSTCRRRHPACSPFRL